MKKFVFCIFMILTVCETSFAADKIKKKNPPKEPAETVEKVEPWYVYRSGYINGNKTTEHSRCDLATYTPGEAARILDERHRKYELIDQKIENGKPVIVDLIQTKISTAGYREYATRYKNIYIDRYARGFTLCQETLNADKSGALDAARYDRYK